MIKKIILLSSVFAFGACAYAVDGQIQDFTIETPGAQNAICYVDIDRLKYKMYPPQTIRITKSRKDMLVDCIAPGNRRVSGVVESSINPVTAGNIPGGGVAGAVVLGGGASGAVGGAAAGALWDATSQAMFKYPEVIYVDFTGIPVRDEALPAHNSPDIKQPEEYRLEEFRPSVPRLNDDVTSPVNAPQQGQYSTPHAKGDLMNVIDHMFSDNPRTAGSGSSYPGQ